MHENFGGANYLKSGLKLESAETSKSERKTQGATEFFLYIPGHPDTELKRSGTAIATVIWVDPPPQSNSLRPS